MTSSEIRQSFLDFFKSKQHTIVSSSSLMPDSPNLPFTALEIPAQPLYATVYNPDKAKDDASEFDQQASLSARCPFLLEPICHPKT